MKETEGRIKAYHDVIVPLAAGPHYPGNTSAAHKSFVNLGLLFERAVFCDGWLEFYSNFLACDGVHANENLA